MEKQLVNLLIWNIANSVAIFTLFIFIIVVLCKLMNRNVKYDYDQLKYKDTFGWHCLDQYYKNSRCDDCHKHEFKKLKEQVTLLSCTSSGKHDYTLFECVLHTGVYRFRCPNCQSMKEFTDKTLTQNQKTIIKIQYPTLDIS
jgi:hypothetical protein